MNDDEPYSEELPRDSFTLIDKLDRLYPHRCILHNETPEQAHRYAGVRELVDELIEWRRATEEEMDTATVLEN